MANIVDLIEKIVEQKIKSSLQMGEIGIVTEVFPHASKDDKSNYTCNIKLKNPDAEEKFLELKKVPIATNHIGTVGIPNVGDMVVLAFIQGSIHQPIMIGRLYHSEMRLPLATTDEIIHQLPPGDKEDEEIIHIAIRNHPDQEIPRKLTIDMIPNLEINIDDESFTVLLKEKKTKLKMVHRDSGEIEISSEKTIFRLKENNDIHMETPTNITMKAEKDITIQAENITLKANKKIEEKAGSAATYKSGSKTEIKSSGPIRIKGTTVDMN